MIILFYGHSLCQDYFPTVYEGLYASGVCVFPASESLNYPFFNCGSSASGRRNLDATSFKPSACLESSSAETANCSMLEEFPCAISLNFSIPFTVSSTPPACSSVEDIISCVMPLSLVTALDIWP